MLHQPDLRPKYTEVLKREVIEGEYAEKAQTRIRKFSTKLSRRAKSAGETKPEERIQPEQDSDAGAQNPSPSPEPPEISPSTTVP